MPYIDKSIREGLFDGLVSASNPGQLNYLLTEICKRYLHVKDENYQTYNDIIGALECCKLELYRRKTALYEDKAIKRNGDVW